MRYSTLVLLLSACAVQPLSSQPATAQDAVFIPNRAELSATLRIAQVGEAVLIGPLDSHPRQVLLGRWGQVAELVRLPDAIGPAESIVALGGEHALVCGRNSCAILGERGFGETFHVRSPPGDAAVIAEGLVLLAFHDRSPGLAGLPLHVVSTIDGRISRSFGGGPGLLPREDMFRHVATGGDGTWVTPRSELKLELWRPTDGRLVRTLEVPFRLDSLHAVGPAVPLITGISVLADTVTLVVSQADKRIDTELDLPPVEKLLDPYLFGEHSDGVVIRVDGNTGSVIDIAESDRFLYLAGGAAVLTLVRDIDGRRYVERHSTEDRRLWSARGTAPIVRVTNASTGGETNRPTPRARVLG